MRSGRLAARVTLLVLSLLVVPGTNAWPCTMATLPAIGPFSSGDSWVLGIRRGVSRLGASAMTLVELDHSGALLSEREISLDVPWLRASLVGVERDGSAWITTFCHQGGLDELCNRLLLIDRSGSIVENHDLPGKGFLWTSERGIVAGGVQRARARSDRRPRLLVDELSRDGLTRVVDVELPEPFSGGPVSWRLNSSGAVAVLEQVAEGIVIGRWSASGDLHSLRVFERAVPGSLNLDDDTTRIGYPWVMELFQDGRLLLTGWQYHGDCSSDRPPGFVVLAEDGRVLLDQELPERLGRVWGAGVAADGSFVLRSDTVLAYDAGGSLEGEWPVMPTSWTRLEHEMTERAERVGPTEAPESWIELYRYATSEKQRQLEQWIVNSWPATDDLIPDDLWVALASSLCRQHPERGPEALLDRYRAADPRIHGLWLEALTICFPGAAPRGGIELAQAVAENRLPGYPSLGKRALDQWQNARDRSRRAWERLLEERDPDDMTLAPLLRDWHVSRSWFEEVLSSRHVPEHAKVRDTLLSTIGWWDPDWGFMPVAVETREAVLMSARDWVTADQEPLATHGRLLLLGHGVGPSTELARHLLHSSSVQGELEAWLAAALLGALSRGVDADGLADVVLEVVSRAPDERAGGATGPILESVYERLAARVGRTGTAALMRVANASNASQAERQRLLNVPPRSQFALELDQWQAILDSPWLIDDCEVMPSGFFDAGYRTLGRASVEGEGLRRLLIQRFRERFASCAASDRVGLWSLTTRYPPSTLLDTIERDALEAAMASTEGRVSQWLWLIARTGAWPAIEPELLALLEQPNPGMAAAALAHLGHQPALDVLLRVGIADPSVPPEAFRVDRERVVDTLASRLGTVRDRERVRWLEILMALGPSEQAIAAVRSEVEQRYAAGELPQLEDVLLLQLRGDSAALDEWLARVGSPSRGAFYRSPPPPAGRLVDIIAHALIRLDAKPELVREVFQALDLFDTFEGRAWLRRLGVSDNR